MLSREEYISLIKEKQKEYMDTINTEQKEILDLNVEYEGLLAKILESNLSLSDLRGSVMQLYRIYEIRFGNVISAQEDIVFDEAQDIDTIDDVKRELQSTIEKIRDGLKTFELSQFILHTQIMGLTDPDFTERVRYKIEEIGNKIVVVDQLSSDEEYERQKILVLESVIGEQPEFDDIMGRN